ncbi:hypothetical protein BSK59_12945 [Paenibacillus odorifer]|uniref:CgeB family protein n=1 Tax=Paenibacillus odorifer TaxID=189426 RepID=UPI00096E3748|nr:glycosyltransferase [Paenibacillus odorifer]OME55381.1 hypothetical protein BSK59_12945 [Paenibacillus odorifer]
MKKLKILFTNSSQLIVRGLKSGFDSLGHETFVLDGEFRLWDKDKNEQLKLFKKALQHLKVDLVFSECFANFSEDLFVYTKEHGIPHFFWSVEDTPHDHWIGDHWSNYADYIFTTTAECLPNYWNKGKQAELMLFACNPSFHKHYDTKINKDITLIANNYDRRFSQTKEFIMPLLENGYDIDIYGNSWWTDHTKEVNLCNFPNTYKGYGAYEDLPQLYSQSKVAIGQNLDEDSVTQTSMRMVEVLGIGGALLVSPYTKAQEYLFNDHIYLPKDKSEIIQMVDEVLSMTNKQRKQKAVAAQKYVYKYHNYTLRAQQVINAFKGIKI